MLHCIIIDDEQFSVDSLMKYIGLLPKLKVVAIYHHPVHALENISIDDRIDLIFMDIELPLISGIDLAKALRLKTRRLIFTTSHSKYAFDAYEVEGDAYLLKPFTFGKFSTTIDRLFPNETRPKKEVSNHEDYFMVKNKEEDLRIVKVCYREVIAFESAQNYIKIHLSSNKILTAYLTIKDILDLLDSRKEFQQFHRAFVISTDCISSIEGNLIRMTNNLSFRVGESYQANFTTFLAGKLLKTCRKRS